MRVLRARNVHAALPEAVELLYHRGVSRESRNGDVLQSPEPVATIYEKPDERVLFHAWRDANPFLHFYESLWMLAGRNDLSPLLRYVSRFKEYSDDGVTMNAAYGDRWRRARLDARNTDDGPFYETRDQLKDIVDLLRKNPIDRQCVLQIWDHAYDLATVTKDHACNLTATFQVSPGGSLDMVVFCRSNDIIWGCYGANAVHFSMLLEYVARSCDLPIGTYTQISVNWHGYLKVFSPMREKMLRERNDSLRYYNPYDAVPSETVHPYPMLSVHRELWDEDVRNFVTSHGALPEPDVKFHDPFFNDVAYPIVRAHDALKDLPNSASRFDLAREALEHCLAGDWKKACLEWIDRRETSAIHRQRAKDDGVHAAFDTSETT